MSSVQARPECPREKYEHFIYNRMFGMRAVSIGKERGLRRIVACMKVSIWAYKHRKDVARKRADCPSPLVIDPDSSYTEN